MSVVVSRVNNECVMDIDYEGTALGVYVTQPNTVFPRANKKFDGVIFFGLDTTTFPDGIIPPVRYGDTTKERSVDTKNGYMHSDTYPLDKPFGAYPMPLESSDSGCTQCQLMYARDDMGKPEGMTKSVGAFKIGVVTVPGNTETPAIDMKECPAAGMAVQLGTDLPIHRGAK